MLTDRFKIVKPSERRYPTRNFNAKELLPSQPLGEIEDWDLGEDDDALLSMISKVESEHKEARPGENISLNGAQIDRLPLTEDVSLGDEDSRPLESLNLSRDIIQAYREKGITHLYEWQVSF